jgi:transcriptional regulator with XRE-family HTH domain
MKMENSESDAAILTELGARLARTRLERNISQAELAAEAGIGKRTIERIERGEPVKLPALLRVLRALNLLERLELLVPEPLPSPLERLKQQGRARRRAARGTVKRSDDTAAPWTWGDEEGKAPR